MSTYTNTVSGSPATFSGVPAGTYNVLVTAHNSVGNGPASTTTTVTVSSPNTVPGAPTGVIATAGNASATVSFTAPSSNGGATITTYTATSSPGGFTGTASSVTPITVTGLTNGTAYTFTVTATNSVGVSAASTASAAVTPVAPPTNLVMNSSAATDLTNMSQSTDTNSVTLTRLTGLTAPTSTFTGTTAFQFVRPSVVSGSYGDAFFTLNNPTSITVGTQVTFSVWLRMVSSGSPETIYLQLSDTNANNNISNASTNSLAFSFSDTNWHLATMTLTATSAGSSTTGFYMSLPASDSFTLQATNFSVVVGAPANANLLSAGASNTTVGVGGFKSGANSGTAPTIAIDTTTSLNGSTQSIKATFQGTVAGYVGPIYSVPVTPTEVVSAIAWVKSSVAGQVAVQLTWRSGQNTGYLANSVSTTVSVAANTPTQLIFNNVTVPSTPSGILYVQIQANRIDNPTVGDILWAGCFEIAQTISLTTWTIGTGS